MQQGSCHRALSQVSLPTSYALLVTTACRMSRLIIVLWMASCEKRAAAENRARTVHACAAPTVQNCCSEEVAGQ
jgi:hypothetical protein